MNFAKLFRIAKKLAPVVIALAPVVKQALREEKAKPTSR